MINLAQRLRNLKHQNPKVNFAALQFKGGAFEYNGEVWSVYPDAEYSFTDFEVKEIHLKHSEDLHHEVLHVLLHPNRLSYWEEESLVAAIADGEDLETGSLWPFFSRILGGLAAVTYYTAKALADQERKRR